MNQDVIKQNVLKLQNANASAEDIDAYVKSAVNESTTTQDDQSPSLDQMMQKSPAIQGVKNYSKGVGEAMNAGENQVAEGYNEFANSGFNPGKMLEGGLTGAAGVLNTVTSLIAPFLKPVGTGINMAADKISDIPVVQDFAATGAGQATEKVANDITNLATVAGGVGGTMGVREAGWAKATPEFTEATPTPPEPPVTNPETQNIVSKRTDALSQIENSNGPVRKVSNYASSRGIDVKSLVANTDLLHDSVDENGVINTTGKGGAIDQFNSFMNKYEGAVSQGLETEGKSIPLSDVEKALNAQIDSSHIAGGAKSRLVNAVNAEIEGLKLDSDANGNISLKKLQDAKISTTNGIDYTNAESKLNAKMIADTYKTLIENNSNLPVKAVNEELSKYYSIGDYLESLNGKRVQGGRLGKYFAQMTGAVAGSHFGPLGSIIGAELAGKIKGTILSNTFGQEIGQGLEPSDLLKTQVQKNASPRIGLPAPAPGSPRSSVNSGLPIQLRGKSE